MKIAFALSAALLALPLPALAVTPLSYDMPNGTTGSYTYHDDSYSGSGSPTTNNSPLAGGLGDLTDGILPTEHWNTTPNVSNLPWVGWASYDPTIVFNFGSATIGHAVFYFDNNFDGGVSPPTGVTITPLNGIVPVLLSLSAPTISYSGPSILYDYDFGGTQLSTLTATLNRNSQWVMLGEVTFDGTGGAVPEPMSWAMMVGGFGLLGAAMRRRKVSVTYA